MSILPAPDETNPKYQRWKAELEAANAELEQAARERDALAAQVAAARAQALKYLMQAVVAYDTFTPPSGYMPQLAAAEFTAAFDARALEAARAFEQARIKFADSLGKVQMLSHKCARLSDRYRKFIPPAPKPVRQPRKIIK